MMMVRRARIDLPPPALPGSGLTVGALVCTAAPSQPGRSKLPFARLTFAPAGHSVKRLAESSAPFERDFSGRHFHCLDWLTKQRRMDDPSLPDHAWLWISALPIPS